MSKLSINVKIVNKCQNYQKMSKIVKKNVKNVKIVKKNDQIVKKCQKCQILVKNCQILVKIVKIVKNGINFQKWYEVKISHG